MMLFSVTAHESYSSINDFIRSALLADPTGYVIVHVNSSWESFDASNLLSNGIRAFVNPTRHYLKDKWTGKTGIHFSNVLHADSLGLKYEAVAFHASNELYLKKIDLDFIRAHKFGYAAKCLLDTQPDFNDRPHHDAAELVQKIKDADCILMNKLSDYGWYGGVGDGSFYSHDTIHNMMDLYYKYYTVDDFNLIQIDDEIIPITLAMVVENMRIANIVDGITVCSYAELTIAYVLDFLNQSPDDFFAKHLHRSLVFKTANNKFAVKGFVRAETNPVRILATEKFR